MSILQFEIPVPEDPDLQAEYLALGWYEVKGNEFFPARLKWSHAAGSPRHPGDTQPDRGSYMLRMLDCGLLDRIQAKLPNAADGPEHVDIEVKLTVRFRREGRKQRHKGAGRYYVWEPERMEMVVGDSCQKGRPGDHPFGQK